LKRRVKAAIVLAAAGLVGFAWWHFTVPRAATESFVLQSDRDEVFFVVKESGAGASAATSSSGKSNPTAPAQFSAVNGPDFLVWDLCGIGRLPIPQALLAVAQGGWSELPKHLGESADQLGREALLGAMAQGHARARAAATLWRKTAHALAAAGMRSASSGVPDTAQAVQARLLELAESSQDAVIASWALHACEADEPCRKRASAIWLRIEPGNAAAWLPLLVLQPQRREEVFAAVAKSERFSNHYGVMAAVTLAAMPSDIPPYVQQNLLVEALAIELGQGLSDFRSLLDLCKPAPAAGSDKQARCDAIARLLIDRSDTLVAHLIGSRIGELAGWPKAQEEARRAQAQAMILTISMMEFHQPMSCASVEKSRAWVRDLASKGELTTMRERAAAALAASSSQR
jgi:hypothetical protein